ncbi:cupin domain-containing protein [Sulfitobacter aestuariivivens]|uniref:Cupin domain-containing protein n=1 Tax=Sulfitobacter aestuariivivens TaxID=2766981 RepID=A0A927D3X9_9RHOB|nr:cupin domain-containing protein [Sulfitobacter aestuariivivens]MBD3664668.1 cupin domain-containing protein [Sulfitobacter aestuariivivens]
MTHSVINFATHSGTKSERRLANLPDRVVDGDPHHETTVHFDNGVLAGTWTSTPGKWHAFTDRDEFCYIVSGHCQLISATGDIQDFRAGDAFLIPNGFKGFWNVIETTTKHFVIRDYSDS